MPHFRHKSTPVVCQAHPTNFGVRCGDEPIRTPNAIQPVGVLLAASARSHIVHHVSANCDSVFGRPPQGLLGADIRLLLAELGAGEALAGKDAEGRRLHVHHHHRGDTLIVEIEPSHRHAARRLCPARRFARLVAQMHEATDLKALYRAGVLALREITGFDRVLMYVFDPLWHGKVVAEDVGPGVPSYLGLHFPSSDIPEQARQLYVEMPLRFVVDSSYQAVPLVTQAPARGALDLSCAILRSLSPLHQEYMRALNLTSSLSVSVLVDGKLFGLLSCAHESGPLAVCPDNRSLCNTIALTLGSLIPAKKARQRQRRRALRKAMYGQLFRQIEQTGDFARILCGPEPNMLSLVPAGGAAVWYGRTLSTVGKVPPPAVLQAIIAWTLQQRQEARVFSCHDLPDRQPDFAAYHQVAAGLMAIYFPRQSDACVLWFRPSHDRTISWGGNPTEKTRPARPDAPPRPRQSFARWRQLVRLQSQPFSAGDRQAATFLVDTVAEGVIKHTERLTRLVADLERSNAELDAFAHAASHDIKEPLRSIKALASAAAKDGEGTPRGAEQGPAHKDMGTIVALCQRMDGLLNALLRYAALGRSELAYSMLSPRNLVTQARHVLGARIHSRQARLTLDDTLPPIWGDPVLIGEMLVNLIGNGIKYNEQARPSVHVGSFTQDNNSVVYFVRDNGIGISFGGQQRVFDIFQRLHGRDAFGGGTGAGLTLCKRIVDRHGGRLWVESVLGKGSTFFFSFPNKSETTTCAKI